MKKILGRVVVVLPAVGACIRVVRLFFSCCRSCFENASSSSFLVDGLGRMAGKAGEKALRKTEIYGIIRIAESFRDKEGMICGIMYGMMLG